MTRELAEAGPRTLEERLFGPGKKRILTLDGGGVRGIVSIAFLAEMERQLRDATGNPHLVLADVFDLIAGTSVGSMLATMLALGKPMSEVEAGFRELAPKIFTGRETMFGRRRFSAKPLINGVRSLLGGLSDVTLGSSHLVTGLCIIAKRVDTGSVWALTNNSRMPYYHDGPDWDGNKHYKLEMLVRASAAAPFLFTPTEITIHTDRFGKEHKGLFVDGAVTPHNNPALQVLTMAALPAYKLGWTLSPDDLLLVSIGTGMHRTVIDRSRKALRGVFASVISSTRREDIEEAYFAAQTLGGQIADAGVFNLKVLQSLSNPRFSWRINGEINALEGELLLRAVKGLSEHLDERGIIRFQRYDLPLEKGRLVPPEYDVEASADELRALHAIDEPLNIDRLYALASEAARKQVSLQDFAGFVEMPVAAPMS
ncbi:MAG: patatin-like phospholipase family protein [Hyphomicrobiaceae bacterium]